MEFEKNVIKNRRKLNRPMREMRRFNRCLDQREEYGLSIQEAIEEQNERLLEKVLQKYLCKCMKRMFGDVSPVQRNTGYPFVWR